MTWRVYILETQNGQLYTGITNNLKRRMKEHESGRGARFTRVFGFKELLYTEKHPTRSDALKRESQIKSWSRPQKDKLVLGKRKRKKSVKVLGLSKKTSEGECLKYAYRQ
ncbi:MAG: GIY-YIG nuclease family protein [Candidatus Omnitrophica bacterium]|nr:GIY-YIG nuclease family protein [Candidatus Omnitrophota bacterium]